MVIHVRAGRRIDPLDHLPQGIVAVGDVAVGRGSRGAYNLGPGVAGDIVGVIRSYTRRVVDDRRHASGVVVLALDVLAERVTDLVEDILIA